jgi:uncharacterized membrane protein
MLIAAPLLASTADGLVATLYVAGSLICHQRPERSFHIAAAQLPVCARCLGLYMGGAAGLLIWAVASRRRQAAWPRRAALTTLAASTLPTAATIASAWLGLGDPANAWRAALALPLGAAGGLVVGAATTNHLK